MEGAGIISILAMLLLAPVTLARERAQKRRLLLPHELNLRRATQPLGIAALLAWGVGLFGVRNVGGLLAPMVLDPAANWFPAGLLGAALLYGVASFVVGARRCRGVRSDGMLPVWAFLKCAMGGAGLWFLWVRNADLARTLAAAPEMAALAPLLVAATGGRPSLLYPFNLFPLRVLKQVVCMFFAVNGPRFQEHQPDLVRFVLNKGSRAFPPDIRIYAFYTVSTRSRAVGMAGLARGFGGSKLAAHVFSEVTFPPFGFVMTAGNTPPPDPTLCEISGFSQFAYQDWRTGIPMSFPTMPVYTAFPGDYRTREQASADAEQSKRWVEDHPDGP